jgi:hypothetical protein
LFFTLINKRSCGSSGGHLRARCDAIRVCPEAVRLTAGKSTIVSLTLTASSSLASHTPTSLPADAGGSCSLSPSPRRSAGRLVTYGTTEDPGTLSPEPPASRAVSAMPEDLREPLWITPFAPSPQDVHPVAVNTDGPAMRRLEQSVLFHTRGNPSCPGEDI